MLEAAAAIDAIAEAVEAVTGGIEEAKEYAYLLEASAAIDAIAEAVDAVTGGIEVTVLTC